jgi:hypothetical protein
MFGFDHREIFGRYLLRAIGEIEILVEERRAAERQKARSKNKKGLSQ